MHHGKRPAFALISLAIVLPLAHADATTLTWSTYPAWTPNVGTPIELNFGTITSGAGYNTANGIALKPLSGSAMPFVFTGPYSGGDQLTGGKYGRYNSISLFGPATSGGNITITFSGTGENAFLLGLGSTGNASSITVSLSDGESFNVAATANAVEFLGLSLSHDVTWVTVSATGGQPVVNDFYFANSLLTQDVPLGTQEAPALEGSTITMLGGGLLALLGARRKLFPGVMAA